MVHSFTSETRFLGTWDELAVDFFTLATILYTCFSLFLFKNSKSDLIKITCTEALLFAVFLFLVTSRVEAYMCSWRPIDLALMLRMTRDNLGLFLIYFLLIM